MPGSKARSSPQTWTETPIQRNTRRSFAERINRPHDEIQYDMIVDARSLARRFDTSF